MQARQSLVTPDELISDLETNLASIQGIKNLLNTSGISCAQKNEFENIINNLILIIELFKQINLSYSFLKNNTPEITIATQLLFEIDTLYSASIILHNKHFTEAKLLIENRNSQVFLTYGSNIKQLNSKLENLFYLEQSLTDQYTNLNDSYKLLKQGEEDNLTITQTFQNIQIELAKIDAQISKKCIEKNDSLVFVSKDKITNNADEIIHNAILDEMENMTVAEKDLSEQILKTQFQSTSYFSHEKIPSDSIERQAFLVWKLKGIHNYFQQIFSAISIDQISELYKLKIIYYSNLLKNFDVLEVKIDALRIQYNNIGSIPNIPNYSSNYSSGSSAMHKTPANIQQMAQQQQEKQSAPKP